jgi:hypothetical protein
MHAAPDCSTPSCHAGRIITPMSGHGWGFSEMHEPHCPKHDDHVEAVEHHAVEIEEALETRWDLERTYRLPAVDRGTDDDQQDQA